MELCERSRAGGEGSGQEPVGHVGSGVGEESADGVLGLCETYVIECTSASADRIAGVAVRVLAVYSFSILFVRSLLLTKEGQLQ